MGNDTTSRGPTGHRTRGLAAVAVVCLTLAVGGCGGDDESSAKRGPSKSPAASETMASAKREVRIEDAVVRVGEKGHATLELTLVNPEDDIALLSASSSAYAIARLGAVKDGAVSPVKGGVPLPKGETVEIDGRDFAVELEHPIMSADADSKVAVRLLFDNGATVDGKATVDGSIDPS